MAGMLFKAFIYLIPMTSIVFFIVSLCDYISSKKQYKIEPNEVNEQKKNATKSLLIVSSVIMGVLLAVVIGFMALMFTAVAYM